jgi:hypothetical protein
MLDWARDHAPGRRVWALEGTGSFAAGLAGELALAGEDVVEVGALKRAPRCQERPARRGPCRPHRDGPEHQVQSAGPRAARSDQGPGSHPPGSARQPDKAINELKSLIVVSPEALRALLRSRPLAVQLTLIESMSTCGNNSRTPAHGPDTAVHHRTHTVPDRPARRHRSRAGPPHPGTPGRTGTARRTRRRTCRRGPAADQLVPPRTGQKRSGIRFTGRRRTPRSQQRPTQPAPPQPRRRPRPEPGPAHRRHHPHQMPRRNPGIRSRAHPPAQDPPRHPPLPQAHPRPAPLPRHLNTTPAAKLGVDEI